MNGREEVITKVERANGYWYVQTKHSGFGFEEKYALHSKAPRVGDLVECHVVNGSKIRGVTLRGELLFYKSDEQLQQEHKAMVADMKRERERVFKRERPRLNRQYKELPPEFQRRIDWFRQHAIDFRVQYEAYEMSVCVDAVLIANTLKTPAAIERFAKRSWEKQQKLVPGLYDGHSGNSFSCAVMLAADYLRNPLLVVAHHGALTPLVGCEEYGCAHPRDADVLAAVYGEQAA